MDCEGDKSCTVLNSGAKVCIAGKVQPQYGGLLSALSGGFTFQGSGVLLRLRWVHVAFEVLRALQQPPFLPFQQLLGPPFSVSVQRRAATNQCSSLGIWFLYFGVLTAFLVGEIGALLVVLWGLSLIPLLVVSVSVAFVASCCFFFGIPFFIIISPVVLFFFSMGVLFTVFAGLSV